MCPSHLGVARSVRRAQLWQSYLGKIGAIMIQNYGTTVGHRETETATKLVVIPIGAAGGQQVCGNAAKYFIVIRNHAQKHEAFPIALH